VLQAQDVLRGNLLLHGWWLADVTFYTTEIPQYALLELAFGVGAAVVHIASAMTMVLIVVMVALLAAGPARAASGRQRCARALVAAVIAASPQSTGAWILLSGPDHTGTVVPVLGVWLLIDRMAPRWWVPVAAGATLTWIMAADEVVLFSVIVPLTLTVMVRAASRSRTLRVYEFCLALAAVAAAGLGTLFPRLIFWIGRYQAPHFPIQTMPLRALPSDAWNTTQGVLELFGANVVERQPALEMTLTCLHLVGVLLAVLGFTIAIRRLLRSESVVVPAVAVAIVTELGTFLISAHSTDLTGFREIVAVMPLGAVLAGRTLGSPLLRLADRTGRPGLRTATATTAMVVLAGYVGGLAYDSARPAVPSANQDLASWLAAQHMTGGLAAYWEADSITLDTAGRVNVAPVTISQQGIVVPDYEESNQADYDPARTDATFLVAGGPTSLNGLSSAATRTFGQPEHVYLYDGYVILTWRTNILRDLSTGAT